MNNEEALKIVFEDEKRPIEPGDKVTVAWLPTISDLRGTVLHAPCATGDSWHIQDRDGLMHYVQFFQKMTRQPSPEWYKAKKFLNEQVGH